MNLLQTIKLDSKPNYEVEQEKFYSEFLTPEDAKDLRVFIAYLGSKLSIPSAILAVGSSVFPQEYFDEIREMNKKNPAYKFNESYRDIDLLIVPEKVVKLNSLEKSVQETLNSLNFDWKLHEQTTSGVSYHKQNNGSYVPFLHFDYGYHSIETNLKNGRKLDLILERDDLLKQTALKKIAEEKRKRNPFSLLYIWDM